MTQQNIPSLPTATSIDKSTVKDLYHPNEEIAVSPTYGNTVDSPQRLCEYDVGAMSGCRRTETILALEAEYDTFVSPEMAWGDWDQFCYHNGYIYYYKNFLKINVERDFNEPEDPRIESIRTVLRATLGNVPSKLTFEEISNFIITGAPGFPKLVSQTPQFFECEDVGLDEITIDNLTRETLNKIESTFTGDIHPLLSNLADVLYIKDNKIYCTDVFAYKECPVGKFGVFITPSKTEKYEINKPYFFPFKQLTADEEKIVRDLSDADTEFTEPLTIIYL